MNSNNSSKFEWIKLFHDDAEQRLQFLHQLYADNHKAEALTLCLSYIDSFSQWLLWPNDKSGGNFVNAIINFGGDATIGLVNPLQAVRKFKNMKSKKFWIDISICIETVYSGPDYELQTEAEFINKISPCLKESSIKYVKEQLWQTTTAAIAYYHLRNPSIHGFGAWEPLTFSRTTYKGIPVPRLDFKRLHSIAINLHSELRRRSNESRQWFGNDAIMEEA